MRHEWHFFAFSIKSKIFIQKKLSLLTAKRNDEQEILRIWFDILFHTFNNSMAKKCQTVYLIWLLHKSNIRNIFHYVLLLIKYMIPYTIHCIKQAIKVKCITPCGPHQEEEKTKADSGGKTRLPAPQLKNNR